jgi:hypothetical protein
MQATKEVETRNVGSSSLEEEVAAWRNKRARRQTSGIGIVPVVRIHKRLVTGPSRLTVRKRIPSGAA